MKKLTKSRDLDMSGLAKTCLGGQALTANQRKYFFQELHLSSLLVNLAFFYKIICFIEQIDHLS